MAKLITLLATSFTLIFIIASASVTITTVEIDEGNPGQSSRRCQKQVQGECLESCEQFLMECSHGIPRVIATTGMSCRQQMQECCDEMRKMDEECRCMGIRKMMQRQQGQMGRQQMERMAEKAMDLPNTCGMGPGHCEMRTLWY